MYIVSMGNKNYLELKKFLINYLTSLVVKNLAPMLGASLIIRFNNSLNKSDAASFVTFTIS